MSQPEGAYLRPGFVSLWVGTFPSVEEAERYFGIPDEIGVYLPPEGFIHDLGVRDFPPENLEVNFEQPLPRPLGELLADATFSASFFDEAVEEAARQGVHEAQGIALLYDFDNRARPAPENSSGRLRFIDTFPYVPVAPAANLQPFQKVADEIGYPLRTVLFVIVGLETLCNERRRERGVGHVSARELCDHLLNMHGEESADLLRVFGLLRSEDVGRVIFGLVDAGLSSRQESDSEADFQGLYALG